MVKYACEICNNSYMFRKDAEKCESKGFLGPDIEPGLLFSGISKRGFLVLYSQLGNEGHDKIYHGEEFLILGSLACPTQNYKISGSLLLNKIEKGILLASDEEVKKVNGLIGAEFPGTGLIKSFMSRYGIQKLHNNFNLEEIAKS